ncbi:MAG: xanthine dehydrogenase family protein molybdopterin-binding subunit [Deltaproteobacteria bacterium]|nr:xanthine dehydrogenase family protein molybdopterin-binding subunit [Deltaproteobacteria bacterium]
MSRAGRAFGQRARRNEDYDLLTGRAQFIDDITLPDTLHVAFVRSDLAHARINSIDTTEARKMPGVVAVYTAADLGDYWAPGPLLVPPPPVKRLEFFERTQVPLAKDKVVYAGEPYAAVVATSRYLAEDAAALVYLDADPLDAVIDLEAALAAGSPRVHEDLASNVAAKVTQFKGDYGSIEQSADLRITQRFVYDRGTAAAIENRGILAHFDPKAQKLLVWDTTQAPIPIRGGLARMLGLAVSQVHVIAPNIGGGFGPKIMMFYPEEVVVPWISKQLGRPVKWIEDRHENFYATTQERGQIHDAELAISKDGRIVGVKDVFLHDNGAHNPYGLTVPINSQCTLIGPYDIPHYHSEFTAVFTNRVTVTPYRGAGRQHGVFVMERLLDIAAKKLKIDPVEIRRRNYIPPEDFPKAQEVIYQDFAELVYDSGNYLPALEKALVHIDYERFRKEQQPQALAEGRHLGIGVVSYIEGTGIGPYEGARVCIEPGGKISIATGIGTQGQGHYTAFAQVVAEILGADIKDIHVVTGDTREFHWGSGTFASRGAVVAGNACHAAALKVREKAATLAATLLESSPDQLEFCDGVVRVAGSADKKISLGDLAAQANPLRGAVKPGTEPGLEATAYFGPDRGATASGVHAIVLEVDVETMMVAIKRYVVVHDCGRVINPLIVEGQIQGGVAQGIGNAFYEQLHVDENGQLLNASLMDFLLPTACDVPTVISDHVETPSPLTPLGVKGAGEAGTIPVGALYAQALEDALRPIAPDLTICEIPLSPNRLFELVYGDEKTSPGRENA